MAIAAARKNGHFSMKEKYSEWKDALEDAMLQNKKVIGQLKRKAENAAYVSGEKMKDAAIVADRHVHKNPWPYIAGTAACAALVGFILGRKK